MTFSASSRHQSRWTFQLLCRRTPSTYYIVIIYRYYNINRRGRVSRRTSKSGLGNPRSISRRGRTSDNITIMPHAGIQQYKIILYELWVYGRYMSAPNTGTHYVLSFFFFFLHPITRILRVNEVKQTVHESKPTIAGRHSTRRAMI